MSGGARRKTTAVQRGALVEVEPKAKKGYIEPGRGD